MSTVRMTKEMTEAGLNFDKIRHSLRRKETAVKNAQRKAAAKGYRGYIEITEKPIRRHKYSIRPETVEPVYDYVDRMYFYERDGRIVSETRAFYEKVGEKVIPEKRYRMLTSIDWEEVDKPYVRRIRTFDTKYLKKLSNKKTRKASDIPSARRAHRRNVDIAWTIS